MAAGLGFKTFTTGEVLTAADTNGYLMQGVLVFASSAARASAITSPQEGQYSYLKDTDALEYYSGSAWVGAPVGDITGVTAGTGISGGGTSGTVTVSIDTAVTADLTTAQTMTNKTLTTPKISNYTTNGDLVYGTGSSVITRLGIGSTSQVLTVAGGVPVWATPSGGGGKVLQVVYASTTTMASNSTSTYADTGLTATITPTLNTSKVLVMVHQNGIMKGTGSAATGVNVKLYRTSTEIAYPANSVGYYNVSSDFYHSTISVAVLDAPATTSATTYKTQFANCFNGAYVRVNTDSMTSTITLMEIGA